MSSCYKCATKYTLFKKEVGCPNCGFSFCSKCCSNKINVPKKDNKALNVCHDCYLKLSSNDNKQTKLDKEASPPANFLKLVEENRTKPIINKNLKPVIQPTNKNKTPDPDQQLADRLAKLAESQKPKYIPTEQEIEERLRKLKGVTEEDNSKSNIPNEDQIKTSDDLIEKINDELRIENKYSDSDPANDIVKRMLEEEDKKQKLKNKSNSQDIEDEEKWCCLCNDDANLLCYDCEDDMYCNKCYKRSHKNSEYRGHRIKQF